MPAVAGPDFCKVPELLKAQPLPPLTGQGGAVLLDVVQPELFRTAPSRKYSVL